ncbi:MAG: AAA family ATPase [Planctomycetaceae bacterium]
MKITDIHIDQFGVWHDLSLRLNDPGISVFYGPNEAGKSTLMRFVRGLLYGFRPSDERTAGPDGTFRRCAGSLRFDHKGNEYEIRRESQAGTRGRLTINGNDHSGSAEDRLQRLLSGAKEGLYENVFAIGLEELQQLGTLTGEEVARHIYGLSLGSEGRRILSASGAALRETHRLADLESGRGVIADLSEQLEKIDRDLENVHLSTERLSQLADERAEIYENIDGLKKRQGLCERNIRGFQFLDRVFSPWKKQRELRREFENLPNFTGLSEDSLDHFDEIELELEEVLGERARLLEDARKLEESAEKAEVEGAFEEHVCGIRNLLERQEDVRKIEKRIEEVRRAREERKRDLQAQLVQMETDVSWDGLETFDVSSHALSSLLSAGEKYRQALRYRSKSIKRFEVVQKGADQRSAERNDGLASLQGRSILDTLHDARRRLDSLEELADLRSKEARLAETESVLLEQMKEFPRRRDLPDYFWVVLWVLGISGAVLCFYGLLSLQNGTVLGGNTAWVVGLVYMLLGACCGAFTWTLNDHFQQFLDWDPSRIRRRLEDIQSDRERSLRDIRRLVDFDLPQHSQQARQLLSPRAGEPDVIDERDVMTLIRRRVVDLEALEELDRRVSRDNDRLGRYRERLQFWQRTVTHARREWTELLKRLGLNPALKVTQAFDVWQQIAELQRAWIVWQNQAGVTQRDEAIVREFREEAERLNKLLPASNSRTNDAHELLAQWDLRLKQVDAARRERRRLLQDARQRRRDAERFDTSVDSLRARRLSILSRAGAADRDELEGRILSLKRRAELSRLLEEARKTVEEAAATEPELAIVEDDLLRFDPTRNTQAISHNRSEMKQLDDKLQGLHERLGHLKREIQQIEDDASLETLSRRRKRLATDLRDATERWTSGRLAGMAIERVRRRFERNCQPDTLKAASEYLERLTCGKYTNVWAPLGEKHLIIDDDAGGSFKVEHLSSGTREQLFLAVRMAMIRELAEQGTELPMVLDDVLVNFDQVRTEAAVETLLDFADEGQQVLFFTCHQHLAQMFENRGCEPVWLPSHHTLVEGRAG